MSAISDFSAKQTDYNNRAEAAIQGLGGDIDSLNATIKQLQDSAGQVTPEDQALLDQLTTKGESLAARFEALDALTPPTPPVG